MAPIALLCPVIYWPLLRA